MPTVIISHKVENYKKWKEIYDRDIERRSQAGLREISAGQKADEPNMVYMVFEASDSNKVKEMMQDQSLKDLMDEAGVISKPELIVIEE
ncbi:hypothetical protein [Salinimicrobium gaetbulicola]|uniref:Cyclase n=1 Tax=Salinimicrobium gaetbulicola TaxID=999702 RepID=A0ABW3ICV5_9FLAO